MGKKTAVGVKVEMETGGDKDDKVLTGFKVNLMSLSMFLMIRSAKMSKKAEHS